MTGLADLVRYDGRRVVVTGCASGIGAALCGQLGELGAEVVGLDVRRPHLTSLATSSRSTSPIPRRSTAPRDAVGGQVDSLFNVAGVSSGIGDPLKVVTINFLGTRMFTEAVLPRWSGLVGGVRVVAGRRELP